MMINRNENEIEFKINEDQVMMFLDVGLTVVKNGDSILARSSDLAFLNVIYKTNSLWKIDSAVCLLVPFNEMPIVISMSKDNDELSYVITKIASKTLADILREAQ